jgi:hypothetical protein
MSFHHELQVENLVYFQHMIPNHLHMSIINIIHLQRSGSLRFKHLMLYLALFVLMLKRLSMNIYLKSLIVLKTYFSIVERGVDLNI